MKKFFAILSFAAMLPLSVHAEFVGQGSTPALTTVANAMQVAQDSLVMLEGHIVSQIDRRHYEFKDASGTVTLQIDRKYMPVENITPQSKVRLLGRVHWAFSGRTIDVRQLEILK
ncbi:hypothetical protein VI06_13120 [Aquitalea magnusonii]|nr:hypothetical protein VI06_13120 [Aquitalea magnusonii]